MVGMACRYPGGGDTAEGLWELLSEGRSAVREVPASRWDIGDYYHPDPRTPRRRLHQVRHLPGRHHRLGRRVLRPLAARGAAHGPPHQRLLLELVWEGLENAGLSPARLA
ncbi:beta-ketoacyl synthase N-terminal-like domain-containing protein [Nonomuraea ferruginea]